MVKTGRFILRCAAALVVGAIIVTVLVAFTISSGRIVTITDGDEITTVTTQCSTVEEILNEADITVGKNDKVSFDIDDKIANMKIERAFNVYVTLGNKEPQVTSVTKCTVADVLETLNISLDENDICNYKPADEICKETYIDLVDVEYIVESYEENIPYSTKIEYSNSLTKGSKSTTSGTEGTKTVTVRKKYENGVLVSTEQVSSLTTADAVNAKTVIGTKNVDAVKTSATVKSISTLSPASPIRLTSAGVPANYSKCMTFDATAYTSSSSARCSTGVKPQPGRIAVNPNVIPYGTKMYIVSADGKYNYGYAIASDTGGFARKNPYAVDLYFSTKSECIQFGRRNVKIYVLN